MSPRRIRFKLLLDEMFPRRENFPALNHSQDIKHVVHDLKQGGLSDAQVIEIAKSEGRIIVTKNIKDFRQTCRRRRVDMIGVSEQIPFEELDAQILSYLKRRKHRQMTGRFAKMAKSPRKRPNIFSKR